ncbi:CaiB/BaiF CoA transferase family protein [Pollutimonas bauzanensis]|uniref:Crotonobetainyl-CoA:carnitine CoA-transferase CaiB n=1 Tax=Pollutimonas bauzanensis TaxID=658167 RepID=A0A1M5XXY0_9BURK|nr:CoA transferase [Pollutimonas bauzanensis]SHI04444.1 Crotonobetainyl-CoA:carnitine CoA-transferase CaiB [Pollutimonas bauzanensis]
MNGPLAGIRVVEVGHMLAGPYCGLMLADMGAEVIKIETPEGDIGRSVSPHFIGPHNAYFASLNRNKKSVVLDLAGDEGRRNLGGILKESHALITNLRPSAIRKLGLTYETLRTWNERLVCVALTGYGLEGPYVDNPAYDYVIQAMTGVMALTGDPSAPPAKAGYSAVDNSAGLVAALGLLAKIVQGQGGQVDVSMYDVMLSQLNYLAGAALNAGEVIERLPDSSHPYVVPAQIFPTADGWLTLFITHDKFWQKFCAEVGRTDWITDPRFASMAGRRANRDTVVAGITAVLREASAAQWVRRLQPLGVVAAEVGTLNDALESDIAAARSLIVTLGDGSLPLRAIASPIRFDGYAPTYGLPPLLDEHREEVLGRAWP